MCAWNESSPNADIRTFTSLQAVYDANYTVVHCGACGDCSNWNDLSVSVKRVGGNVDLRTMHPISDLPLCL